MAGKFSFPAKNCCRPVLPGVVAYVQRLLEATAAQHVPPEFPTGCSHSANPAYDASVATLTALHLHPHLAHRVIAFRLLIVGWAAFRVFQS